jgi:hypothetical protein
LFPGDASTVSIPEKDPSLMMISPIFDKYGNDGYVGQTQIKSALKVSVLR